jgi:hypothetical protein
MVDVNAARSGRVLSAIASDIKVNISTVKKSGFPVQDQMTRKMPAEAWRSEHLISIERKDLSFQLPS